MIRMAMVVVIFAAVSQGHKQELTMSSTLLDINNYCDARCNRDDVRSQSKLLRGPAGEPGPRGPPGIVDYNIVQDMVKLELNETVLDLEDMIRRIVKQELESKQSKTADISLTFVNETPMNSSGQDSMSAWMEETDLPASCQDINLSDAKLKTDSGGVFTVYVQSTGKELDVWCDLAKDDGGWTVFQRRMDGSEKFYRGWDDYVNGFGEKDKEFWLGLENIHQMTKNGSYELRIDLIDSYDNVPYAKYGFFSVGPGTDNYRLSVSSFSGNAGDSLAYHDGMQFTTRDADHDVWSDANCAKSRQGAWWFNECAFSNLNGIYHESGLSGLEWYFWRNWAHLKFTEMKFRKKSD